jgi:hypothetical protein
MLRKARQREGRSPIGKRPKFTMIVAEVKCPLGWVRLSKLTPAAGVRAAAAIRPVPSAAADQRLALEGNDDRRNHRLDR